MNFLEKISCIISVLFLFYSASFSQTGWVAQTSGTSEHLQSVFFVNDMTGWTVGYAGKILKTTNGGTNWISQTSPTPNPLLSVYFVSATQGWAVGSLGVIIATGNGGATWVSQSSGIVDQLNSVYFFNAFTGWAAGQYMQVLKTTNSGTNWVPLISSSLPINSVIFTSSLVGYIGGDGFLYKSTNGGLNWTAPISNPAWFIKSVHFPAGSTTIGYAVGMGSPSPPIFKTTDSGNNWTLQPVPLGNALTSVFFTSVTTGWAAGWGGSIMYTFNGGANWSDQISGTANNLRSIYFANSLTGWTVGDLGTILKTSSGGISAIEPISNIIPEHFSLYQNYPNPFNPTTNINFSIPICHSCEGRNPFVSLKIYDALGNEIAVLVNEELKAGTYNYNWDASNYPCGVYFYKLIVGDYRDTKKMIIVK